MRIPRDASDEDLVPNLTPFIDMMFILIVFFLATSRFTEAERDESIRLAQTRSAMPISTPTEMLVKEDEKCLDLCSWASYSYGGGIYIASSTELVAYATGRWVWKKTYVNEVW